MKLFIMCTIGFVIFISLASYLIGLYKLKTDPKHRIFFDLINLDTGSRTSANIAIHGDTKEEAEKLLRDVIKRKKGNYGLVIYETIKDEPDTNLTEE